MTTPTREELLRLARKAWPEDANLLHMRDSADGDVQGVFAVAIGKHYDLLRIEHDAPLSRQALHAALLVLAGELDVAALLAELDRLRDGIKLLIAGAEEERYGGGPVVGVGQLEQLLEDP